MSRRAKIRSRAAAMFAACFIAAGGTGLYQVMQKDPLPLLDRIRADGELVVATRRSPSVFFIGAEGPDGFEHELIQRFAETLDVAVVYVFPEPLDELIAATSRGTVHLAAAGLALTPARAQQLAFSEPYRFETEQLVYRRGSQRPQSIDEIGAGELHVVKSSSHEETLSQLRDEKLPELEWTSRSDISSRRLLEAVNAGDIPFTIASSSNVALQRRVYPYLAVAFQLSDPKPIAWAFSRLGDDSLLMAANRFLHSLQHNGELNRLQAQYFGHAGRMKFVDVREFWRGVGDRLPTLQPYFQQAQAVTGIDWRLLAAVGYQESHWREDAVSPTGVRGIMMLTQSTAKQMGVSNRNDPKQSITGGARYLRVVEKKIPERITEPNRLWLTLAAYNIGFGHLEDARILTQRQGGDPDLWLDVKQRLPLLTKKKYHSTLKYGYARGHEPVDYVDNIRNYYDLLVWYTTTDNQLARQRLLELGNNNQG